VEARMRWTRRRMPNNIARSREDDELRRARDDLAAREACLDALMDSIQVAIMSCDADGRIVHQNAYSRELTGGPVGGEQSTALVDDISAGRFTEPDGLTPISPERNPLQRALRDGEVHDAEILLHNTGECPKRLLVHGQVLRGADGGRRGAVVAGHDITALREREDQLARANAKLADANQLKVDLMVMLSHEINQPLFAITGYTDLLTQDWDDLDDHRRRTYVERLDVASRTLRQVVADLLLMFRVEAGMLAVNPTSVRLVNVLGDALASIAGPADVRTHTASATGDPGNVQTLDAFVDSGHLRQILINLITNATNYGAPPIDIHLHGPPAGSPRPRHSVPATDGGAPRVRITVRDHGPGVPDEFVPQLFDRFTRAAVTKPGSGLGLFIVRQLLEANGGTISYQHAHPHGATFTIDLPAMSAAADPRPAHQIRALRHTG
jgi:signal transduction histidine kinase